MSIPAAWAQNTQPFSLPDLNAPVIDRSNTLNTKDIAQLDAQLRAIHQAGRAQMGIVLVSTTGHSSLFDYALRIANQWQLGDAKSDNGLLIVLAVQDRRIQILTGYGLEGILPDVIVSRIIREDITPHFRAGDYAAGLRAGLQRIDEILLMDPATAMKQAQQAQEPSHKSTEAFPDSIIGIFLSLLVTGQFLRVIFGRLLTSIVIASLGIIIALALNAGILGVLLLGFILPVFLMGMNNGSAQGGKQGSGGYRSGGGGFSSGGGFSGGGGGFGGGGASGSW